MDTCQMKRKIVDLSDADLISLGFAGENIAPRVKAVVDQVKANPELLGGITCFMVSCIQRRADAHTPPPQDVIPLSGSPISPPSPPSPSSPTSLTSGDRETIYSLLSNEPDAHTAVDHNLISEYEANFWYHGISSDPPRLLWRSDLETSPFPVPPPGTNFADLPTKTALGIFDSRLNEAWDDAARDIIALLEGLGIAWSALNLVRFSVSEGNKGTYVRPDAVWIAVRPHATNAGAVRDATPAILNILTGFGLTDVVVEWYEGTVSAARCSFEH